MNAPAQQGNLVAELGALAALSLSGAAFAVRAVHYGIFADDGGVGTGFLPFVVGVAVGALGLAMFVGRLRAFRSGPTSSVDDHAGQPPATDEPDLLGRTERERRRNVWVVAALLGLALICVPLLGLVGSMVVFTAAVAGGVERRPWPAALAMATLTGLFVWAVFGLFLHVPLPIGIGG